MKTNVCHWLPRVISVLYTIFIAIFGVVFFQIPNNFIQIIQFFLPVWILLIANVIGWKYSKFGAISCAIVATGMILLVDGQGNWLYYTIIVAPMYLAGLLYMLDDDASKNTP